MTLVRFDPAGADGANVANISGFIDQVIVGATSTVKYKTTAGAARGTGPGVEIISVTAGETCSLATPAAATTDLAALTQAWVQFPDSASYGTGAGLIEFARIRSGTVGTGANVIRFLVVNSDHATLTPGTIYVQNSAGVNVTGTANVVMTAGTWYRLELGAKPATTTTGSLVARIYSDTDTLLWDLNHTAADQNLGTAGPTRVAYGKVASSGGAFKMWVTQVGIDTAATIPTIATVVKNNVLNNPTCTVAPSTGAAPRSDGTNGTTFTVTISSTGGNGSAKTYAMKVYRVSTSAVVLDTTSAYVSSASLTWTPAVGTTPGDYDFEPYVSQT